MKYRVTTSRWDVNPENSEFYAENDEKAMKYYEKHYLNNPSYEWDWLTFVRIDQEEKTTHLHSRN